MKPPPANIESTCMVVVVVFVLFVHFVQPLTSVKLFVRVFRIRIAITIFENVDGVVNIKPGDVHTISSLLYMHIRVIFCYGI